jgi:hypothetical protein
MREPPLVRRPPPLKTTRNTTATPNLFRVAFRVPPSHQHRKDVSCTGRALSPSKYSITSPALWPSRRNYPSRRVDPSPLLRKKKKVAQSYSSTTLWLTTRRIVKSAWPHFATRRTTSWTPSTTMNNSRTSQLTSPPLMLPKTKTRTTKGSGG